MWFQLLIIVFVQFNLLETVRFIKPFRVNIRDLDVKIYFIYLGLRGGSGGS